MQSPFNKDIVPHRRLSLLAQSFCNPLACPQMWNDKLLRQPALYLPDVWLVW